MAKPKQQPQYYSATEYFVLEERAEGRSEYYDGELLAMSGGTANHNRIAVNLTSLLNAALDEKGCEVFVNDLRVQIAKQHHYTYPDLVVVCGDLEFVENRQDTIANPLLIIEVLSASTRDYDRGSKFAAYRTIPTLREYLLVESEMQHVEAFRRSMEDVWQLRDYDQENAQVLLESVQVTVSLRDIYKRVQFAVPPRLRRVKRAPSHEEK
jgi:Uma2 family endonuclease